LVYFSDKISHFFAQIWPQTIVFYLYLLSSWNYGHTPNKVIYLKKAFGAFSSYVLPVIPHPRPAKLLPLLQN
jgi:hypothetical protein